MTTQTKQTQSFSTRPEQLEAPGPDRSFLLGNIPEVRRKGQLQFYIDAWQRYGDVVRLQMGPMTMHLVTAPDYVRQVLVTNRDNYPKGRGYDKLRLTLGQGLFTSEGQLWQRQRRMLQPPFTPKGVQAFAADMQDATAAMLADWETLAGSGEVVDIHEAMMQLAMAIIGRVMFGVDVSADAAEAADAFAFVLHYVGEHSVTLFDVPLFIPTADNRRLKAAMRTLNSFIAGIIAEREQQAGSKEDLLSHLLSVRDERGEPMSDKQLQNEILTIFFAGHETTAQALTWIWSLLSRHPLVERGLHDELDSVLGGRTPAVEDLPNLPYTRAIVDETLRLYPPVWGYVRDAAEDDVIGGYHIPAGSMVMLSQYITHRHPQHWSNPEGFDPGRWLETGAAERHRYAYFPFGSGPRICLGDKFALLEAQLVLATVAQRFRLELEAGTMPRPEAVSTLRPAGGMPMTIHNR